MPARLGKAVSRHRSKKRFHRGKCQHTHSCTPSPHTKAASHRPAQIFERSPERVFLKFLDIQIEKACLGNTKTATGGPANRMSPVFCPTASIRGYTSNFTFWGLSVSFQPRWMIFKMDFIGQCSLDILSRYRHSDVECIPSTLTEQNKQGEENQARSAGPKPSQDRLEVIPALINRMVVLPLNS